MTEALSTCFPKELWLADRELDVPWPVFGISSSWGTAGFPADVVLAGTVNSTPEAGKNEMMIFPWLKDRDANMRQFSFVIPGVTVQMFTGNGIKKAIRAMCIVRSPGNYVYMAPSMEAANMANMARLLAQSRPVGDLR